MDPTLSNDRLQRTDPQLRVIRNRNRHCAKIGSPLHDNVTPALANDMKSWLFEDAASSRPERTRSLPTGGFEAGDKHFSVQAAFDFGRVSAFEKEIDMTVTILCPLSENNHLNTRFPMTEFVRLSLKQRRKCKAAVDLVDSYRYDGRRYVAQAL